jgi:hypothetical protein
MRAERRTAAAVGVLYIIGTVMGGLAFAVTDPLRTSSDALAVVSANAAPILLGSVFWLTMGLALAMVPVLMFPILRKRNPVLAMGYIVFRGGLETVCYIIMAAGWLVLLPLSRAYQPGTTAAAGLQAVGNMLLQSAEAGSIGTVVFCLGALMFSWALFSSKLIPRWISGWGLVAALPYLAGGVLGMVGVLNPASTVVTVMDMPLAVQEMVLAVWLIVKGFRETPILGENA